MTEREILHVIDDASSDEFDLSDEVKGAFIGLFVKKADSFDEFDLEESRYLSDLNTFRKYVSTFEDHYKRFVGKTNERILDIREANNKEISNMSKSAIELLTQVRDEGRERDREIKSLKEELKSLRELVSELVAL